MFWKGVCFLETGLSMGQAQKMAAELKDLLQEGINRRDWSYYYLLAGLIEMKKGASSNALENINRAVPLLSHQYEGWIDHAIFFAPLAEAYYQAGDLKKAQEEYDRVTLLTSGRMYYGDIYVKSFYMLGKIAEQQRDKARVIFSCRSPPPNH